MSFIKDKYIDMVKTRVDICKLVLDMHPGVTLKSASSSKKMLLRIP